MGVLGSSLRRIAAASLTVACVAGVHASPAAASYLVYRCGAENLCEVNPDGSGQRQLAITDGAGIFRTPSLSLDGTKLAYVRGNSSYVRDMASGAVTDLQVNTALVTAMRPDGAAVAVINEQTEAGGSLTPWLVTVNADGSGYANVSRLALSTGWLGSTLLRDGNSNTDHQCRAGFSGSCPAISVCRAELDGSHGCQNNGAAYPFGDVNVADDPVRNLYSPAGSPDGTQVLAVAQPFPNDGTDYAGSAYPDPGPGTIAVFDAATGKLIKDVSDGTSDDQPAWSPDGAMIAFSRGGAVYVMPAGGGAAKRLVAGDSPTWGGGAGNTLPAGGGGAVTVSHPATARRGALVTRGIRVKVRAAGPLAAAVGLYVDAATAKRLGLGRKQLALVTASGKVAGSRSFTLRPKAKYRSRLAQGGRLTVVLVVVVRDAAGGTVTRTYRIKITP